MEIMTPAEQLFTAVPKRHNCAQAVAEGAGRADLAAELASCGGGRAPGGTCGALHAALLILPEEKRAAAREKFIRAVGAASCREIKTQTGTPCLKCVAAAAGILERECGK